VQLADYVSGHPRSALGHEYYAGALFNAGRLEESIGEFRRALALNPRSGTAQVGLGVALHFSGDDESAEEALRSAVQLDPSNGEAWFFLALAVAAEHPAEAREALQRCTKLSPDNADGWHQLALMCIDLNYNEEAARAAQQAVKLQPEQAGYYEALGEAQFRAGHIAESLRSLKRAIELEPKRAKAQVLYGTVMLQSMKPDLKAAEEAVRAGVRLAGPSPQASVSLGRIAERRGDLAAARGHYEEALWMEPRAEPALFGLGSLLVKAGERKRGEALLAEFQRLADIEDELATAVARAQAKPEDPERQLALARALRKAGDLRLAAERYDMALRLRDDAAVRQERAEVVRQLSKQAPRRGRGLEPR